MVLVVLVTCVPLSVAKVLIKSAILFLQCIFP